MPSSTGPCVARTHSGFGCLKMVAYREIEPDHNALYGETKPEVLTEDMTMADLANVLAALRLHGEQRVLVSLDCGVRDYLLRAIRPR